MGVGQRDGKRRGLGRRDCELAGRWRGRGRTDCEVAGAGKNFQRDAGRESWGEGRGPAVPSRQHGQGNCDSFSKEDVGICLCTTQIFSHAQVLAQHISGGFAPFLFVA